MIYRFQWIRRAIGGKWGCVTGWFFGKRWVRLPAEALEWDEFWISAPPSVCKGCGRVERTALLWGGHDRDCKMRIPF
jgi:hypothetical protein